MRIINIFCLVSFLFFHAEFSFALDWKQLHNLSEEAELSQIISELNKDPNSIDRLYMLGLIYLNLHKDDQARGVFDKIISLAPKAIEAKWGLAEVLRRKRQFEQSNDLLEEVIKERPEFSPAYISLAYIKYTHMEFEEAVKLANVVLRQGKDNVDLSNYTRAYLMLAGAKGMIAHYGGPLSKMINGTAVLPNLQKAERLQPDSAAVLFGLGSFYLLAPKIVGGNLDKAGDYLEKAIAKDPLFADAYARLALVHKIKNEDEQYQRYLNKALEIDPENELVVDMQSKQCRFICISTER